MLSPVHASHDGVNTALSAEEVGGFALSTPRQGQLAGLRDAVGNRVSLVSFCVSEYSHYLRQGTYVMQVSPNAQYVHFQECKFCSFFILIFFIPINFYRKIYKLQCQ
jgi:hypothetical protein